MMSYSGDDEDLTFPKLPFSPCFILCQRIVPMKVLTCVYLYIYFYFCKRFKYKIRFKTRMEHYRLHLVLITYHINLAVVTTSKEEFILNTFGYYLCNFLVVIQRIAAVEGT